MSVIYQMDTCMPMPTSIVHTIAYVFTFHPHEHARTHTHNQIHTLSVNIVEGAFVANTAKFTKRFYTDFAIFIQFRIKIDSSYNIQYASLFNLFLFLRTYR